MLRSLARGLSRMPHTAQPALLLFASAPPTLAALASPILRCLCTAMLYGLIMQERSACVAQKSHKFSDLTCLERKQKSGAEVALHFARRIHNRPEILPMLVLHPSHATFEPPARLRNPLGASLDCFRLESPPDCFHSLSSHHCRLADTTLHP